MPKKIKDGILCPCGSQQEYSKCCDLYTSGLQLPSTAEALMRSRYTAYTQANISYIQETMRETAAQDFDPIAAEKWARKSKWKRLQVIDASPHETDVNRYYVKFTAYYISQGKSQQLTEISEFKRIDGKWYYINGSHSL